MEHNLYIDYYDGDNDDNGDDKHDEKNETNSKYNDNVMIGVFGHDSAL